ncbi:CMRF35-like molecule 1 isoform X2 [Esox lucius]|uniref:CMRF35-like molecule 1 isoform X2 n=1 Tax=Esox lucius TaxID=8010 RepID=UPI001476BB39|nr:CMRF35-like molecule 1 isoform X2 [Esox lucius]
MEVKIKLEKVCIAMVTILLAPCKSELDSQAVIGVVGGRVIIKCSYTLAETSIKYFCKGICLTESGILIQTQDSENCTEKGRYSIFDFRNGVFAVTIKDLKKSDSGTYWCRVDRIFEYTFQQVKLSIMDDWKALTRATPPESMTTNSPESMKTNSPNVLGTPVFFMVCVTLVFVVLGTPVVIMVCVSLGVLVLGLIVLLIYKWRRERKSSRLVTNLDTGNHHLINLDITLAARYSTYQDLNTGTQDSTFQTLNTGTQDSTYQTLNTAPQDSTFQTLNTGTQDSTYQNLNTAPQDSTFQTLNTGSQDSTYQTLNTAPLDSTFQTLNTGTQDSTYQTLNMAPQYSNHQDLDTGTQDSTYQTLNTTPQNAIYHTINTTP